MSGDTTHEVYDRQRNESFLSTAFCTGFLLEHNCGQMLLLKYPISFN